MRCLLIIVTSLLIGACNKPEPKQRAIYTPYFIPGTYVAFERGNFCAAWDTLVISVQSPQNRFKIRRSSWFQRNLGEEYFPAQHKFSEWAGLYDNLSHVLSSISSETQLLFLPAQTAVQLDGIIYQRVR